MNIIDLHHATVPEARQDEVFYVYGTPVVVRSNNELGMELARASLGAWNRLRRVDLGAQRHVDLAIMLTDEGQVPAGLPSYRVSAEAVSAAHGDLAVHASRPGRSGFVHAPRAFAAQYPLAFRRLYLECAAQFLASHYDRVPLHAAVAVQGDHALLLCGPSGSGKSTLLYALMQAGAQVLGEESVCVSRLGGVALWGVAQEIGLRAGALALFPELSGASVAPQPNGREKYAAPIPPAQRAYPRHTGPRTVVFLDSDNRVPGVASVTPIDLAAARARLLTEREAGFDLAPDYAKAVDALLVGARCVRATRGESPSVLVESLLG